MSEDLIEKYARKIFDMGENGIPFPYSWDDAPELQKWIFRKITQAGLVLRVLYFGSVDE